MQFLSFGSKALQRYAEIKDDGEEALLFQTVKILIKSFSFQIYIYIFKINLVQDGFIPHAK
jgi:hypothetical protein